MAADVKHIKAQIDISAAKANAELSKLANKLEKISASISEINQKGLEGFTNSVEKMGQTMQILGNIDTSGLAHFADSVQRLSGMNFAGIGELSSALTGTAEISENVNQMTDALGGLEAGLAALNGVWDIVTGMSEIGKTLKGTKDGIDSLFGAEWMPDIMKGSIDKLLGPLNEKIKLFVDCISLGAGTIGQSFSAVFGISVGAAVGIVAAIAAVVLAVIDLWNTSEQFRDIVGLSFTMVKDTLSDALQKVGDAITPLWESIKGLGAALYDLYESSGLKAIVEILASLTVVLAGILGSVMIETLSSSLSGLARVTQGVVDVATGLVEIFTGLLTGFITFDGEKVLEGISMVGKGLIEIIMGIGEGMYGAIFEIGIKLYEQLFGGWNEDIKPFFDSLPEQFEEMVYNFFKPLFEIQEKIFEIGRNIISGLWEGISGEQGTLKQGVGDICLDLVDGFRENLDIHSPSKALAEIGSYAILGLAEPFSDSGMVMEQIRIFAETLMNIIREQLSPENFALIAETALLAFMETFRLGFENMQLASGESMQLLSMSVVNALTMMSQQIGLILTAVTMLMMQKWTLMLNQTRLIWLQLNQMIMQNLILLNTNITTGMTAVNIGWTARWSQFVSRVRSACTEVQAAVSALNDSVQGMCSSMMSAIRSVKAAASSMASVSVRTHTVRGFASGGYPEIVNTPQPLPLNRIIRLYLSLTADNSAAERNEPSPPVAMFTDISVIKSRLPSQLLSNQSAYSAKTPEIRNSETALIDCSPIAAPAFRRDTERVLRSIALIFPLLNRS